MNSREFISGRVMIIDDDRGNVALLDKILRQAGFREILGIDNPLQAAESFLSFAPDLLLLDLNMPHRDGFGVLSDLQHIIDPKDFVPIVVLTGDDSPDSRQKALGMGAIDFLTKPIDRLEVVLRISNLLHTRHLHVAAANENLVLEARVRERTSLIEAQTCQLEMAKIEILNRLALAAEFRDDATGRHTQRVGELALSISQNLGLSTEDSRRIRLAAPLHDIGKIGIPDAILLKPAKLTAEEFELMKTHTVLGERLLSNSDYELLTFASQIAISHHENWDGTGYPRRLAGEDIPLVGRIVSVADVFDALVHQRAYKEAWTREAAIAEIRRLSGTKFDPNVVDAFLATKLEAVLD